MKHDEKLELVPVWEKAVLSMDEAVAYTGLGRHTLTRFVEEPDCPFVIWSGRKRLFKRKKLDEFIDKLYSV